MVKPEKFSSAGEREKKKKEALIFAFHFSMCPNGGCGGGDGGGAGVGFWPQLVLRRQMMVTLNSTFQFLTSFRLHFSMTSFKKREASQITPD